MGNVEEEVLPRVSQLCTDHDLRRQAIANEDCSVSNRFEYLRAVKAFNDRFKTTVGRHWMQYIREPLAPSDSLEKLSGVEETKIPKGKPCGLVMVWTRNGKLVVTGSVLHSTDKWNKHLALFYAINRIDPAVIDEVTGSFTPSKLPKKCFDVAAKLVDDYLEKNR